MYKLLLALLLTLSLSAEMTYNPYSERYVSSSGVEYQYDTSIIEGEVYYDMDIQAQIRDETMLLHTEDVTDNQDGFASEYGKGIYEEY